jgi:hypothetical protein
VGTEVGFLWEWLPATIAAGCRSHKGNRTNFLGSPIFASNRVLQNKHQAVSQGVRRFGKRSPPEADEHLQKPHNDGSRPQAQFFNTLVR